MFGWLRDKLGKLNSSPLAMWSVHFEGDDIVTSDGSGSNLRFAVGELQKVIVQTDDSGPWGADVLFFLFTANPEPAGIFPIEAQGCQEFVNWLSKLPGFRDRELAQAMGSTEIARFIAFQREG